MKKETSVSLMPARFVRVTGLIALVLASVTGVQAVENIRGGKEVYDSACAGCHTAGVLQAPRLNQKEDWVEREKQGFEVLMSHAIKGFKNMPAKGGNPTIKDQEISNAITYMLASSGFDQYAQKAASEEAAKNKTAADAAVSKSNISKPATSSANQFNRLMQSASDWNPPPPKDGIHDPENPGTLMLQEPKIAFESLSKSKSGNRVDWTFQRRCGPRSHGFEYRT
jgi:cytochrome c5